jgi:TolB-like protein/Tfp pilus assembly protein PilF
MAGERFAFGPFVLNPEAGTLLRDGLPLPVGYRAVLLLTALLKRPGEVVTKGDLIDAAWQGQAVEETNLSVQIAALRKHLGASPDGGEWIGTISRVGYRFAGSVERQHDGERAAAAAPVERSNDPSIAVLPFTNLTDDPAQEFFADGVVEDIITGLARLKGLSVIARNSSFLYKGKAVDVRQVGRELAVRYVLEGSVRKAGDRVRITTQLIDAETGTHIWSERYDRAVADLFAVQDEITQSVVAVIEPRLYAAESHRIRTRPPENLDAWGFVMRAMPHVWAWASEKDIATAQQFLTRAVEIDPSYARANSLLSWTHGAKAHLGLADFESEVEAAYELARLAIQLDTQDPWAHLSLGYVHMVTRRHLPALEEISEAIERNPSFALAHMIMGSTLGYGGKPEEGIAATATATRLSPRDFVQAANLSTTGTCHFVARRYEEAAKFQRRAVELRPYFGTAWRSYAAASGMLGDLENASHAVNEALRLQPNLSLAWVERFHPIVRPEDIALYVEGLRRAGLRAEG